MNNIKIKKTSTANYLLHHLYSIMSSQTPILSLTNLPDKDALSPIKSRKAALYKDLILSKVICEAKFQVLSGHLPFLDMNVAVKIFPFEDNEPDFNYLNEIKSAHLRHENVISILHHESEKLAVYTNRKKKVSYTVMELAPHGDFFDLINSGRIGMDTKLTRTFFHQLIAGIEYLHSMGVAHMDLKCENLLLGEDYKLKIGDFDQAYIEGQSQNMSRGTVNYRAPEQVERTCRNPKAVDIYSAGVILFTLQSGGFLPYSEQEGGEEVTMFTLMHCNRQLFWERHSEMQEEGSEVFDKDFKTLFMGMVAFNPEDRMSIQEIKESKWYKGAVYSQDELESILKSF